MGRRERERKREGREELVVASICVCHCGAGGLAGLLAFDVCVGGGGWADIPLLRGSFYFSGMERWI